jgi:glycosyltransferase involved in cell wall biosynthesis
MTLTVAIPYFDCPTLVGRAVGSILGQTYRDLVCVVIGDGQDPPLGDVDNERLVVYRLPENRGTYFAQQVALMACGTEWFSIHAADDWSDAERFEQLMAAAGDDVDVVLGGSIQHSGGRSERRSVKLWKAGHRPRHVASIATAVVRTAAVQAFGWWSQPEFRVTFDSMMVNLAVRALRWKHVADEFGYHRVVRADSLTRAPSTGLRSEYRRQANARRAELWNRVIAAPRGDWPAILAPAPTVAADVRFHAERLAEQLQERAA